MTNDDYEPLQPVTWTITFTTTRDRAGVLRRIAKAGMNLATISADGVEVISPWSLPCKKCYAAPGEPCVATGGFEYRWDFCHKERTP